MKNKRLRQKKLRSKKVNNKRKWSVKLLSKGILPYGTPKDITKEVVKIVMYMENLKIESARAYNIGIANMLGYVSNTQTKIDNKFYSKIAKYENRLKKLFKGYKFVDEAVIVKEADEYFLNIIELNLNADTEYYSTLKDEDRVLLEKFLIWWEENNMFIGSINNIVSLAYGNIYRHLNKLFTIKEVITIIKKVM